MDDALATLYQQERQRVPATLLRLLGSLEAVMDSRPSKYHLAGASQKARSGVSPLEVPMRILFVAKPVVGSELRIQYKDSYAFLNSGSTSDSGRWRTEGSSVCNEWKTIRASCSEMRLLGQALYVKRANNGEVMRMLEQ